MNPYVKKIVELHKIHKAIENCNGGGNDDVTPTPEPTPILNNIALPFVPGKIVGYLENQDWSGYNLDYNTMVVDITGDIIAQEDLEQYILSHEGNLVFVPILEYDETLDYNSSNYHNKGGLTNIQVYSNDNNYSIGYSSAGQCYKGTKNGENYIIIIVAGD